MTGNDCTTTVHLVYDRDWLWWLGTVINWVLLLAVLVLVTIVGVNSYRASRRKASG